jgi:hypothetical protein
MTKQNMTKPKKLRWMGREWKALPWRGWYSCGTWNLHVSPSAAHLHHRLQSLLARGTSQEAALAKLARIVRAVGRLSDG